ncbi:MAG: hypothetical protein IPN93_09735 [Bacteroidetes bacterium]|nr:hypothetical protein [Bacteroidota bacterium]
MRIKFLIIAFLVPILAFGQQLNLSLNPEYLNQIQPELELQNSRMHTAIKPYLQSEVEMWTNMDSTLNHPHDSGFHVNFSKGDILEFRKKQIYFGINPLIDITTGYDFAKKELLYRAGYGAELKANFGKKVSIGFNVQGVLDKPLDYVEDFINETQVVPGYREANKKDDAFSSIMYSGYVSYSPSKNFNIQVGNDKNFWGDGYRSMFLSDNASNNPYLRLSANFWKIKYVYLLNFMNYQPLDSLFKFDFTKDKRTKYSAMHYLSVDFTKTFQWGFFESVVWERADTNGVRGVEWNYLNPMVFIRPVEFAVGSPDNVTLGMNFKFKPVDKHVIYSQFLLDDLDIKKIRGGKGFYRTKIAAQIGYKTFDLFKVEGLSLQSEFNLVRPYVFAHKIAEQNYTNFNQSLAHPLNANFYELLTFLRYNRNNWTADFSFQYAKQGVDEFGQHVGNNIFVSDFVINFGDLDNAYDNKFLQGSKTNLISLGLKGGYLINKSINLRAEGFFNYRTKKTRVGTEKNAVFGITLKTGLFNRYTDF